jgi:hypothetical protein
MAKLDRNKLLGGAMPFLAALLVYIGLLPVAYLIATFAPGRKDSPFWPYLIGTHAIMCGVVVAGARALISVLKQWAPRARLRAYTGHIDSFIFALGPPALIAAIIILFWKLKPHG